MQKTQKSRTEKARKANIERGKTKSDKIYFYMSNDKRYTSTQLSRALKMPLSTVTNALMRLQKDGLVEFEIVAEGLEVKRLWYQTDWKKLVSKEDIEAVQALKLGKSIPTQLKAQLQH